MDATRNTQMHKPAREQGRYVRVERVALAHARALAITAGDTDLLPQQVFSDNQPLNFRRAFADSAQL